MNEAKSFGMDIQLLLESIENSASFAFSRSGGPGGQNVNKVNTRVQITVDIAILGGLSSTEKERIIQKLSSRLKDHTNLSLFVDEERAQFRNREIAVERILSILKAANHLEKRRIPTKPGKAAKLVRLTTKKARSTTKSFRKEPRRDD